MITHIVMFNVREDHAGQVTEVIEQMKKLGAIPLVRSMVIGECFGLEGAIAAMVSTKYRYGAVFTFDSKEDLHAYLAHTDHVATVTALRQYLAQIRAFELETVKM